MFKFLLPLFFSISTYAADGGLKVGVTAGYSPMMIVALSSPGNTYSLTYGSAMGAGVDLWVAPKNSWGFISGLFYEGDRKLSSGTYNGLPVTGDSKYQMTWVYAGTLYRWDSFYIPLGISYGIPKFTPASGATGNVTASSGVGAHLGLGWMFDDHWAIDYIGRSATTTLAESPSTSTDLTGILSEALLTVKFFF